HYVLDPLHRWNLKQVLALIAQRKYFLLHAPRQTGKTTCLRALADYLNQKGGYACVHMSVERARTAGADIDRGLRAVMAELGRKVQVTLRDSWVRDNWPSVFEQELAEGVLMGTLQQWCQRMEKPVILLIDEIDSLADVALVSVLQQLRNGYGERTDIPFPNTVVLCGMRDLRDYKIQLDKSKSSGGPSPFNINSNSLRLGDFSQQDIGTLYRQHTNDTGQMFEPGVVEQVFAWTQGQPWLVNALAYEACFGIEGCVDSSKTIGIHDMQQAKEALIKRRETHIDQLLDKLREPRVYRVVEPILLGINRPMSGQDVEYGVDLGLLKQASNGALSIANPIYQEVIPRALSWKFQTALTPQRPVYIDRTGQLRMDWLLTEFQQFFRQNSDSWLDQFQYKEAGPHLILQAFLQRVVNGGGIIHREYALGRGRTDLLIRWPITTSGEHALPEQLPLPGIIQSWQEVVLELKLVHGHASLDTVLAASLEQTAQYMQDCGTSAGHLLLFDRRAGRSWDERIWVKHETARNGQAITVWGL
ncbi:MAG: ATP-binding protein, partial [Myxococcota bacterium]